MKNKSGFLTLCFSFVPSAGQMYQGYMRRGVSVLLAFCAAFWLTWFMDAFGVLMGVVWMVSFFDSLNLRSRILSGIAEPDDFLFDMGSWAGMKALVARRHKLVGWGLVFVGVYALYNKFILGQLYWYLEDMGLMNGILGNVYAVLNRMPELLGCMAVIAVGVWLVKGPQQPEKPDYEEYQPQSDTHEGE